MAWDLGSSIEIFYPISCRQSSTNILCTDWDIPFALSSEFLVVFNSIPRDIELYFLCLKAPPSRGKEADS